LYGGSAGPPRDDFQREALARVLQAPQEACYRFEIHQGRPALRCAVADHAGGEVRGVLEVLRPIEDEVADALARLRWTYAITVGTYSLGVCCLGLIVLRLRRSTARLRLSEAQTRAILDT